MAYRINVTRCTGNTHRGVLDEVHPDRQTCIRLGKKEIKENDDESYVVVERIGPGERTTVWVAVGCKEFGVTVY